MTLVFPAKVAPAPLKPLLSVNVTAAPEIGLPTPSMACTSSSVAKLVLAVVDWLLPAIASIAGAAVNCCSCGSVPLNSSRSTNPEIPATVPELEYCQKAQLSQP